MFNLRTLLTLSLVASTAFAGPWARGGGSVFHGAGHGWASGGHGWAGGHGYSSLRVLPRGYATYHWGGAPYYRYGGGWYRPWRGSYLACYPPLGLWLDILPFGFASYYYGGVRYYSYEDVYYTDAPQGGYVVADPPPDRQTTRPPAQPQAGSPDAAALDALLILPKEGQSAERMKADRTAAQRYALQKSGYDPADSDPSDPGTPRARRAYLKAMRSYLETRGYSVE
jgi:hypothetical protein